MIANTLDILASPLPSASTGNNALMGTAEQAAFRAIVTGDKIVTANRAAIEECVSAARKDGHTVRCTIRMAADPRP
ncbi:DUF6118 family protein [Sphingomonas sp. T1]|jgi:hypothetical protein|uniref:DUF6118 family protein n=1 Tax=Sphingomonas sp. T1 TaxID=2653172 RepID=UPI0013584D90|nr:DUF6118 family protein [Sphingomonas sp. T1]